MYHYKFNIFNQNVSPVIEMIKLKTTQWSSILVGKNHEIKRKSKAKKEPNITPKKHSTYARRVFHAKGKNWGIS